MKMNVFFTLSFLSCYALSGCVGEAPPASTAGSEKSHDDHDHGHDHGEEGHAHFESFSEAVADIAAKTNAIKEAMEADDLKKADGPVHSIGHVLEGLEELAAKQGLEGEQLAEVTSARDSLFEAFAGLDETIHGKEDGKSWSDVSEDIEKAVAQLQSLVTEPAEDEEEESAEKASS